MTNDHEQADRERRTGQGCFFFVSYFYGYLLNVYSQVDYVYVKKTKTTTTPTPHCPHTDTKSRSPSLNTGRDEHQPQRPQQWRVLTRQTPTLTPLTTKVRGLETQAPRLGPYLSFFFYFFLLHWILSLLLATCPEQRQTATTTNTNTSPNDGIYRHLGTR